MTACSSVRLAQIAETSMTQDRLTGGCQCGAVRYSIPMPESGVHLCHCRMCQKAVGNVFAALAPVLAESVQWTRGAPTLFASSTTAKRGFCSACGTPLTFAYGDSKHINFTIGSLDDPSAVQPEIHYGVEGWVPWLELDDELEREETTDTSGRLAGMANFQHPDHDTDVWPR